MLYYGGGGQLRFQTVEVYSNCPKSGRPDFGAFENPPVCDLSGFQTLSINRTILSGYRTSGSYAL